jgi:hypothetical protein
MFFFFAEKNKTYNPTLNAEFRRRPAAVGNPPCSVKLTNTKYDTQLSIGNIQRAVARVLFMSIQ